MRRPRLAQRSGFHRTLRADHQRKEIRRAADGGRAVLGAGLAEPREILGDGEIAGHADFLAAADAHAVDARDHRLVAAEDRRHHVVEQAHVLPVFLRIAGVIFGIFLGVAAGAERLVAHAGKDHRDDVARIRGGAEGADDALHHIRRVGIELAGIVEPDPGVEQARNDPAVSTARRALLVDDAGNGLEGDDVVIDEMGLGHLRKILSLLGNENRAAGELVGMRLLEDRLMSSSGCCSTKSARLILPSSTRSSAAG